MDLYAFIQFFGWRFINKSLSKMSKMPYYTYL